MAETCVAVLGLGYVGCVTAACLARLGHGVIGVDSDPYKVQSVLDGRAPFVEPGLEEIIEEARAAGRLSATTSLSEGMQGAQVALICVGTPSERNGNLGLAQLRRVCGEIGALLPGRPGHLVVAVRSTVFPGTCEDVVIPALGNPENASVVSNPEFLREGAAVKDFLEPSLIVVGGEDPYAVERVASLYTKLGIAPCLVSLRTAEMIKYACNTFHALKVAFANEVGSLCSNMGISGEEVMDTLCRDEKLNISRAYLKPGFAFGGSCLPKDLRALVYRAGRLDVKLPLLESVLPSNREHLDRGIRSVLDLPAERLAIFGLAFKENTDDLRESPVIGLLEQLIGKGRTVRIFDPYIRLEEIYGSNQRFVLNAIPHVRKLMEPELENLLAWGDAVVITQKPSSAHADLIRRSGKPVLDLAGAPRLAAQAM